LDTEAPVIELIGDDPMEVVQGGEFTDPGAIVTDNVDEQRTIDGEGLVDTSTLGTYTLTYNASDAAGNAAVPVTRTVNVAAVSPATAPVISHQPESVAIVEGGSVSFSVEIANVGLSNFQWRKDGVDVAGENGSILRLPVVSEADRGSYTVFISNPSGSIESAPALLVVGEGRILRVHAEAAGASDGASWQDAFTNLQDALRAATTGDEIWVATGVYTPGTARTSTFRMKYQVAIYGGFAGTETQRDQRDWVANPTVLSGDIDGNDTVDARGVVTQTSNIQGNNAYHVVSADANNGMPPSPISNYRTAILDGFTITGGLVGSETINASGTATFEAGIRCVDPCLSGSTQAAGQMPLHLQLVAADGAVLAERRR
jgi:hypothetical protein